MIKTHPDEWHIDIDKIASRFDAYAARVQDGNIFILVDDPDNQGYLIWIDIGEVETPPAPKKTRTQ